VNPYAATAGSIAFDRKAHAEQLSELVKVAGAHLGAVFDPDGEHITVIDDNGQILSDDDLLFVLMHLTCATRENAKIAVPVSVSRAVERTAQELGAEIVWTKLSTPHLMEVASTTGVCLAASQEGGYIFPSFLPAYDSAATLVNLLALLAERGVRLSKLASQAPKFHIAHEAVPTPWEAKGLVMRTVIEQAKDEEVVLVDGVKMVFEDGWVLVLPDPEDTVTHVWAEGASAGEARALVTEQAKKIRKLLR
jgi:mannose-1-phosphate guanylyltransferase / phosphomannomutase